MYKAEFLTEMRQKLAAERQAVESEILKLTRPEEPMDNPSPEDLASDAAEDIIEESLIKVHRDILEKIDNALLRIKDGTYGRCLLCGNEIKEANLAAEPWLEFCEVCDQKTEGKNELYVDSNI